MASDNGSLVTTLALSDIIHTHSPSPAPQAPPEIRPQDASVLPRFESQSLIHDVPQDQSNGAIPTPPQDISRAPSPEPLTVEDVSKFRSRLVEMGLSTDGMNKKSEGLNISSREEELLDMVLALTRSPFISSEQLVTQASMILALQTQRDHLVAEIREERSRMEAERDGWERSAEALIAQRNKPGSGATPSEELERKCSTLESDNRILKDRLQDAHNRANALEAEIIKLKPMLLMLPSSHSTSASNGVSSVKGKGKKRKQQTPPNEDYPDREQTPDLSKRLSVGARIIPTDLSFSSITSTSTHTSATNSSSNAVASTMIASTSTTPSNRSDLYRFPYPYPYPYSLMPSPANQSQSSQTSTSTPQGAKNVNPYLSYAISTRFNGHPSSTGPSPGASSSSAAPHGSSSKSAKANAAAAKSKRRSSTSILQSLTSDARTEHILLASRKVGRERAALLAGLVQQAEKEKLKYTKDQEAGRAAKESERLERERVERLKIGGGMYYRNNSNVSGEPSTPKRGGGVSQQQQQAHHTQYHKPQRTPTFVYVTTPGHSNAAAASAGAQTSTQPQPSAQVQPAQSTSSLVPPGTPGDQIVSSTSPVQRTPRQQHSTLPPNNSNSHAGNSTTSALPQTPQPVQQQGVMQTPLDSLLSAARSLMSDDEGDNNGQAGGRQGGTGEGDRDHLPVGGGGGAKGKGRAAGANGTGRRRGAAALEEPESPLPKRRRTNAGGASVSTGGGVGGATSTRRSSSTATARQARVPSALDVLADQAQVAAAMSSHSGSQHSQHNTSNARAETMTTASVTPIQNDDDPEEAVTSKRRVSTRRKGKGKVKESVGEVEEVKSRVGGSASDGESEVEPVDGDDNVETVLPTPPPAPPPPRKRGRPRKDKSAPTGSAVSKPTDASDPVKEESGVSGRRRAAGRGRAAAPLANSSSSASASASASIIRTRGMKESTQADSGRETPASTSAGTKRGRGGKTRSAPPARTTTTPVPTSISPSAPRIIAPPPELAAGLDDSSQERTLTPSPLPVEEDEKVSVDKESTGEDGSPEQGTQPQPQPQGSLPVAGETKDTDAEEEDRRGQEDGDIAGSQDPSESQSVDGAQERGTSRAVDPSGSPGAGVGGATGVAVEGGELAPVVSSLGGAEDVTMDVENAEVQHSKGSPPISTKSAESEVDVEMGDAASQPPASSTSVDHPGSSRPLDQSPAPSPSLQDQPSSSSTLLSSLHQEHGSVSPEGPGQASPRESTPSVTVLNPSAMTGPIEISEEISTLNSSCGAPPDNTEGTTDTITEIAAAPATSEERGHSPLDASISVEGDSISNGMFNKENADHDSEIDAEHDADMDAEADEDLDAEGEYEDEREGDGGQSTWSHVAFSSSDISKLLQGADEEGEDADAEGEIEDELDEPSSSTVFYPSQLD